MHLELSSKQLELLKQAVPRVSRIAVLWNAANPAKQRDWRELKPTAQSLGLQLESREVRAPPNSTERLLRSGSTALMRCSRWAIL
jgi:putative ABC transport system substrate-binding protein